MKPGPLTPYRVLDLTQNGAALGARMLGDMGADVIKVEPEGGDPSRRRPPFAGGAAHLERSLFWWACNANKRSVTLDIARLKGRDRLLRLATTADFLFESFAPGYLERLGLGYRDLRRVNPSLIMVSVTPFGQTGPYAQYRGPDIVPWAMGGYMWLCGDMDRAPVRPSVPEQAYFHAGAMACGAALIALYHRTATGVGQHVDQSAQACGPWMMTFVYQAYEYEGRVLTREGSARQYGKTSAETVYPCKDGWVVAMLGGGAIGGPSLNRLVRWMDGEGMAPEWMKGVDWEEYDARSADQAFTDRLAEAATAFFRTKSKAEVQEAAVKRQIHMAPVNTTADIIKDRHLQARGYWREVQHPEVEGAVAFPGPAVVSSETPWDLRRRPPLSGEHNDEVFGGLLGL